MYRVEDSCNKEEEEEDKEIYVKLSVTRVTKRDISVAIALSIHGIGKIAKMHGTHKVREGRPS